ncbi:hypothetical protein BN903_3 [Halorubrum sp. AJ67]|nr:hypothetical protein BN903_3 [Halorubrum sp. AJ67]
MMRKGALGAFFPRKTSLERDQRRLFIIRSAVARASERPFKGARSAARGSQRRPTGAADEAGEV